MIVINPTVKKTDATSEVILFMFNSFLLPKGITSVSLKKIFELMKPFDKSESSIRMGLSRAVKAGVLKNVKKNEQVYYEFIESGDKTIKDWKEVKQRFWKKVEKKKGAWNNYWCMVTVDIHNKTEQKDELISTLKDYGFQKISKDTYIHPYDFSRDIELIAKKLNIEDNVKIFMSKLTSFHSPSKLVSELWNVDEIKKKYMDFSFTYPPNHSIWSLSTEEEKLIPYAQSFIHDFTEIMKIDPVLPNEFLGTNWEGDNVLRILDQFNRTVVPRAKEAVDKILSA